MGKKVREYKSGDFIFAKVKGYPAWPARVQKLNGKKYFVYFYGTGETANLSPNMIFDYAENKDKFLTKSVKRRDFNDGVKQIEYDFANNVPLEEVIGVAIEAPDDTVANDSANETMNDTVEESVADTTTNDDPVADETLASTTQNDAAIEDSDETGALIIDEGKKSRKSKDVTKAPATPKQLKEPKTPRGKGKKDDLKDDDEGKIEEDIVVSRSGRKIRPKRYIDEQTEDNATLPSPAPKKRRGASPPVEKEKEKEKQEPKDMKHFNAVTQFELEDLKEPFKSEDPDKENILIAYLPVGEYVGIKVFNWRPASFKNDQSRLQWEKNAATKALTLKMQLEKGYVTAQSVSKQLILYLHLTEEEKATLDKERETDEKRSRVQFLKTEMKLIELDAKIKTCLCLEKADTEQCLKLLDELMELQVKPLMLLKHPTCLETVKRMRAYVGNTPSWDLSESAALVFGKQAHRIRKQADTLYKIMKDLFATPDSFLSFWEYFSERVLLFKKATSNLSPDELLEMVHEPPELLVPTPPATKAAVEVNEQLEGEDGATKKKNTPAKSKKSTNSTPVKTPLKRQSSRKQQQEDKEKDSNKNNDDATVAAVAEEPVTIEKDKDTEKPKEKDDDEEKNEPQDIEMAEEKEPEIEQNENEAESTSNDKESDAKESETSSKEIETSTNENEKNLKTSEKNLKDNEKSLISSEKNSKVSEKNSKENDKNLKENDKNSKESEKSTKDDKSSKDDKTSKEDKSSKDSDKNSKASEKNSKESSKSSKEDKSKEKKDKESEEVKEDKPEEKEKEKQEVEPRAKRSRENKKTDTPPPRSPAKRKSKF